MTQVSPPVTRLRAKPPWELNAGTATVFYFIFFGLEVLFWVPVLLVAAESPAAFVGVKAIAAAAAVLVTLKLIPGHLRDTSPTGAAWVSGSPSAIVKGLLVGLVVGGLALATNRLLGSHIDEARLTFFERAAQTPGLPQLLTAVSAVLVAPLAEELPVRGIFYGGYRKSFGPIWAFAATTLVFILMHLSEIIRYRPALFGLLGLACAALACRLRWKAVGPAVAVHIGYNGAIAARLIWN